MRLGLLVWVKLLSVVSLDETLMFLVVLLTWKFRTTKVDAFRSENFRVSRVSDDAVRSEATLAAEAVDNVKAEKQDV